VEILEFVWGEVNREGYSASANVIYSPIPKLSFGLEYMSA